MTQSRASEHESETRGTAEQAGAAGPAQAAAPTEPTAPAAPAGSGPDRPRVSRRAAFTAAGFGAAMAGLAGFGAGRATAAEPVEHTALAYDFRGEHQAGILTPAQDTLYVAAFDVSTDDAQELKELIAAWTVAAEQMCAGELVGGEPDANEQLPPKDTGEAWGYPVSGLTITFGVGKSLFVDADGNDRFGLKDKMPAILDEGMPSFRGDQLREAASDGDLLIQVCSDDAQVSVHAIRNLTRIAFGTATMRWSQIGYGRTSSTSTDQETPRNLFGFKDGTNNVKAQDSADELAEHLWVQPGDDDAASWMEGGTYFVARKIRMYSEVWDRIRLIEQEQVFGRDKRYGAPLSVTDPTSSKDEFTAVDYEATDAEGEPLVPADSHISVVAPERNSGRRMLRRGYNYTEGNDSLGQLQTGLFFIAFVRDPRTNFYPILDKMTKNDALQEYLQHRSAALFAVPRGVAKSDTTWAQALFA
ncbi:iron uptake transporter deferrochelatase/peroxidase subunit [Actinomyces urogenitalis]|uniref:iron uptake transporter deferrochelatase/peroxidase subunit n=1 Tax=Actinomyces urogenitalis TaxID=103621 RepID=UPI0029008057|nr:iron uptake transporter deferrochelatase/peroxidase subunit [Actinomyces urogenitalis]MDU0865008.1 iron uptake transporter deferrochelatase/peroxidase subunit [Actinomyces urogenitalis]MDU0874113.1 iron uptake transporter deferrochelatase/peroxidase subunit [Actinomyces urogenitalis]MDU1563815.1 iron uptake transporter deferrochelatase/peroxidase subunit [Actinomyces urogenitalis]MDU1639182.1 iron uptake transporter deferrochelatase/peroxidase subunit [Actinomyces urogenitalis]MDU5427361.1 